MIMRVVIDGFFITYKVGSFHNLIYLNDFVYNYFSTLATDHLSDYMADRYIY